MHEVLPAEAKHLMDDEDYAYLDVRTPDEYQSGHPTGAVCIPAFYRGPGGFAPNPDFVATVQRHFQTDEKIIVGCAAGGRSARAIHMLAQHGFTNLINCACGYQGGRNPATGEPMPGWQALGLPIETGGEPLA